jgi:carboxypeptidase Q
MIDPAQTRPRRVRLALLYSLWMSAAALAQPATAQRTGNPPAAPEAAHGPLAGRIVDESALAARYEPQARRIVDAVLAGNGAYAKLTELCDDIGHRLSGSEQFDAAIGWAVSTLRTDGHEFVRTEPVMVPKWVRGRESLTMLEPRERTIPMLGLGGSTATPPEGITAEVVVVRDLEDLTLRGEQVRDKIVLFNYAMSASRAEDGGGYGSAVRYRVSGARWAAEHGALAALVRSVTTRSFQSPHTGGMNYWDAPKRVPAAAISVEAAEFMARCQERGIRVVVTLKMEARDEGLVPAANVIAELRGSERPEEIVVIGGHLDSWDVGQGAHDDGGGCVMAMEALTTLRKLGLRPRRTIRVVLFANEENGVAGGKTYARIHADDLKNHVAAIEADSGSFAPLGFSYEIEDEERAKAAGEQLRDIARLLEPLGATRVREGGSGADIGPMRPAGVPLLGQNSDMSRYFDIHHTEADTLDKVNPDDLSRHVAAMAIMAYVLADMPERLGDH